MFCERMNMTLSNDWTILGFISVADKLENNRIITDSFLSQRGADMGDTKTFNKAILKGWPSPTSRTINAANEIVWMNESFIYWNMGTNWSYITVIVSLNIYRLEGIWTFLQLQLKLLWYIMNSINHYAWTYHKIILMLYLFNK